MTDNYDYKALSERLDKKNTELSQHNVQLEYRLKELEAEVEKTKERLGPAGYRVIQEAAELSRKVFVLQNELKRTENAAYHGLLHMSAWLGIQEKKRMNFIQEEMENVSFIVNRALNEWENIDLATGITLPERKRKV